MIEQIIEFLKSDNYINACIIGFIILFNIFKEGLMLLNNTYDNLIEENKELLSEKDINYAKKHIKFNLHLIIFLRVLIWLLVIILLISMINFF